MELIYKPNFQEARKYWKAYWNNEIIDRPLLAITSPKSEGAKDIKYKRPTVTGFDGNYKKDLMAFEEYASNTYFAGESMPNFRPGFGPDQFSAFLGAKIEIRQAENTSWVDAFVSDWDTYNPVLDTSKGSLWNKMLEQVKFCAEYSEGKFHVAMIDIHSNMDCFSAIRGPGNLCMDLMDCPDKVEAALAKIRKLYKPVYDAVYDAAKMKERGCVAALPLYCDDRFVRIQCDFLALIGPVEGKKHVIPSLREEASYMEHCLMHYDGPQALVHLDSIIDAKEIEAIQWVPGAGQPKAEGWIDLYKKLQQGGKKLQIGAPFEVLKKLHKELKPEGVAYYSEVSSAKEADEIISWFKKNT
jgi:hypothetical protein